MSRFLWTQKRATGPHRRVGHAMVYDATRDRVVLFGGDSLLTDRFNDTWEWDGTDWTQVADIGPSRRSNHAMAYDSVRQRVVLFGGQAGSALVGDTWEWDGTEWTQVAETGPGPRAGHAAVFDSQRKRTVLFGGELAGAVLTNDTWEWDGEQWTQQEDTGPTPRSNHAMAFDDKRDRIVLFGGQTALAGLRDTWEWDGTVWTERADFGPDACLSSAMATRGDGVVLFGGVSSVDAAATPVVFGTSWEWNGKHWTERQDIGPGPRWRHAMTFNTKRGRVVLFGGLPVFAPTDPALPNRVLGDTWEHEDQASAVPSLLSLVLAPTAATIGIEVIATVSLAQPAPPGGVTVTVTSRGQLVSPVLPATFSIPENQSAGQVSFPILGVVTPGNHSIDATSGGQTKTATLTIF